MNEKDEAACKEAWAKYTGSKAWPKSIEFAAGFAAAIEYRDKQAEPVAQPYAYVYEFDSGMFGIHRSFSSNERNGSKPSRVVPVYTHPAQAVAPAEVVQELVKALGQAKIWFEWVVGDEALQEVKPLAKVLEMTCAALAKAKEHGL